MTDYLMLARAVDELQYFTDKDFTTTDNQLYL